MKFFTHCFTLLAVLAMPFVAVGQDNAVSVSLSEDGTLDGHVYTLMEDEKAPIAGKVSLVVEGKTVSTLETDPTGNFSFKDIEPGKYQMIGVAGEYVGDQVIEVTPFTVEVEPAIEEVEMAEAYTAVPLLVAPSFAPQVFDSFGSAPLETFSTGGVTDYAGGFTVGGGCSTCGDSAPVVSSCGSCGGGCSGGCGGGFGGGGGGLLRNAGGGLNFRRLALIGGTVGLAVGISGPASPDN